MRKLFMFILLALFILPAQSQQVKINANYGKFRDSVVVPFVKTKPIFGVNANVVDTIDWNLGSQFVYVATVNKRYIQKNVMAGRTIDVFVQTAAGVQVSWDSVTFPTGFTQTFATGKISAYRITAMLNTTNRPILIGEQRPGTYSTISFGDSVPPNPDTIVVETDFVPPNTITNLSADTSGSGGVNLTFTVPNANPDYPVSFIVRSADTTITEFGDTTSNPAQIAVVNSFGGYGEGLPSYREAVTCSGTADEALVVTMMAYNWSPWDGSVSLNGSTPFTLASNSVQGDMRARVYILQQPTAGLDSIHIDFTISNPYVVYAIYRLTGVQSYTGNLTSGGFGAAWPDGQITANNLAIGDYMIDAYVTDDAITSWNFGQGQVIGVSHPYNGFVGDMIGASSYKTGVSGTGTMSLDFLVNGTDYAAAAIVLKSGVSASISTRWSNATPRVTQTSSTPAGASKTIYVGGLSVGKHYFAIKSVDAAGNVSALSNVVSVTIVAPDTSGVVGTPTGEWNGGYGYAFVDSVIGGDAAHRKFVDSSVAVSGNGTFASPYKTINAAIAACGTGDSVLIRKGTYPEQLSLKSNITITSYKREHVRVTGTPSATPHRFFIAGGLANVRIQGIDFKVPRSEAAPVIKADFSSCSNIIFVHNDLVQDIIDYSTTAQRYARSDGIIFGQCKRVTFIGNYVYGWSHGLWLDVNTTDTSFYNVQYNHITHIQWINIIIGFPADVTPPSTQAVLIKNNLIEDSYGEDGIQWQPFYPSAGGDPSRQFVHRHFKHIVEGNVFRDIGENMLDTKATGHIMVDGNYAYRVWGIDDGFYTTNNGGGGLIEVGSTEVTQRTIARFNVAYSGPGGGSNTWYGSMWYHNTLWNMMRGYAGDRTRNTAAIMHWDVRFGNVVKNNLLVNNYIEVQSSAGDGALDIDGNDYYHTAGGGSVLFSYYSSGWQTLTGLTAWRQHWAAGVSGKDANSMTANPLLANVPEFPTANHTSYDFTPDNASPLVGAAVGLAMPTGNGTGTSFPISNVYCFRDAWGMSEFGVKGDSIVVGAQVPVEITAIDYNSGTITVSQSITYSEADQIFLYRNGKKVDDIGAIQR